MRIDMINTCLLLELLCHHTCCFKCTSNTVFNKDVLWLLRIWLLYTRKSGEVTVFTEGENIEVVRVAKEQTRHQHEQVELGPDSLAELEARALITADKVRSYIPRCFPVHYECIVVIWKLNIGFSKSDIGLHVYCYILTAIMWSNVSYENALNFVICLVFSNNWNSRYKQRKQKWWRNWHKMASLWWHQVRASIAANLVMHMYSRSTLRVMHWVMVTLNGVIPLLLYYCAERLAKMVMSKQEMELSRQNKFKDPNSVIEPYSIVKEGTCVLCIVT